MAKTVRYDGDPEDKKTGGRNMGRHGFVKVGQALVLSDEEFAMIEGDGRFAETIPPAKK